MTRYYSSNVQKYAMSQICTFSKWCRKNWSMWSLWVLWVFVDTFRSCALCLAENHYYITPTSQNISHVHMPDIPQKQQNVLSLWRLEDLGIISSEHIFLSKFVRGQILLSKWNKKPHYPHQAYDCDANLLYWKFQDGGKKGWWINILARKRDAPIFTPEILISLIFFHHSSCERAWAPVETN